MSSNSYFSRYEQFTKKLHQARLDAGLTQIEVAGHFGKHQSFVSKCESGERRVDFIELEIFAKLYSKSLSYFATDEGIVSS